MTVKHHVRYTETGELQMSRVTVKMLIRYTETGVLQISRVTVKMLIRYTEIGELQITCKTVKLLIRCTERVQTMIHNCCLTRYNTMQLSCMAVIVYYCNMSLSIS